MHMRAGCNHATLVLLVFQVINSKVGLSFVGRDRGAFW